MSLLKECSECNRENVGGDKETGICHRCRDSVEVSEGNEGEANETDK